MRDGLHGDSLTTYDLCSFLDVSPDELETVRDADHDVFMRLGRAMLDDAHGEPTEGALSAAVDDFFAVLDGVRGRGGDVR